MIIIVYLFILLSLSLLSVFHPCLSVQYIMLEQKYYVKEHGQHRKHELHNVKPSSWEWTLPLPYGIHNNLKHWKTSSCKIKNNICKWPPYCALPFPVQIYLHHRYLTFLPKAYTWLMLSKPLHNHKISQNYNLHPIISLKIFQSKTQLLQQAILQLKGWWPTTLFFIFELLSATLWNYFLTSKINI